MDAATGAITTGVVVTVGRWTQGKGLEASVVIGAGVYAIFLSSIAESQPQFAGQVASLVLVTALLLYVQPIAKSLGYTTGSNKIAPVQGLPPATGGMQ